MFLLIDGKGISELSTEGNANRNNSYTVPKQASTKSGVQRWMFNNMKLV